MRELFDRLLGEGEAGIDRLVGERTQESVTLDFKEARGAGTGTLANEDRKTFAKALSAFANSAGGLLVFGVEARKGADDVDCAQTAKPIANIARFKSEATTASGQLLQPRHDGIAVEAIPSQREPGAGYLLVHVERSERRPHRSEAAGQKQYFKRAGDSSFEMEHYDIEDAFRRVATASLELRWSISEVLRYGDGRRVMRLTLLLHNASTTSALHPYLHVRGDEGLTVNPATLSGYSVSNDGTWLMYSGGADTVVNPGTSSVVVRLAKDIVVDHTGKPSVSGVEEGPFLIFDYRIGCMNAGAKTGSCRIDITELAAGSGLIQR